MMKQHTSFENTRPENQFLLNETVPRNGLAPKVIRKGDDSFEKQPLFERPSSEPVRLTPAWEETNLPNDELNFKGVTMEQADLEMNPPRDRLRLVYLIFLLHGIGTLMPWNMFINAKSYFEDYKLGQNYTGSDEYAKNFLPYIGFAAQIPNLLFNWLNIFIQIGGNLTTRIVWSILVEVVVFIFTVILAMCDSSTWPDVFFWVTIVTVVILNMANGIYQNTVFGMAAKLPSKYSGAIIVGANISGTFSSVISIISKVMSPNSRTAAIYYFITAMFILLVCFDTYFALPLNRFFRYHELQYQKEQQTRKKNNFGQMPSTPYWQVFKQCLPQCFNVFFVFFVTLTIFPNVHSDIQRVSEDFFLSDLYYTEVLCFLTFNVTAMIGSSLSAWITWPSPKYLVIPVVLRIFFIPFFTICNYQPHGQMRVFPVFIKNDIIFWAGGILLGLTSGHLSSLAMMYCPRSVEPKYATIAGMFGAASLVTGIFAGIMFTLTIPEFVTKVAWRI